MAGSRDALIVVVLARAIAVERAVVEREVPMSLAPSGAVDADRGALAVLVPERPHSFPDRRARRVVPRAQALRAALAVGVPLRPRAGAPAVLERALLAAIAVGVPPRPGAGLAREHVRRAARDAALRAPHAVGPVLDVGLAPADRERERGPTEERACAIHGRMPAERAHAAQCRNSISRYFGNGHRSSSTTVSSRSACSRA